MRRLFIAEKPSLARAIAEVLGEPRRRENYLECGADLVAWCAGHILELADAEAYDPDYKTRRLDHLPIVPTEWQLSVKTPELLRTIRSLLPRVDLVVHAGDPDREGQLLVDEVIQFLGFRGPVERILVSDMNPSAVRKALSSLQPNTNFRPLSDAAVGRQRADWLYGINMTRLYTVLGRASGYEGGPLSVGRVQTPLLGLIVRRDIEIESFVPHPYLSVVVEVGGAARSFSAVWRPAASVAASLDDEGRLVDRAVATALEARVRGQPAVVSKATRHKKAERAPLPYTLAELQIDAGRRLGLRPQVVLAVCQALYETHRLATYPRSDCAFLPEGHLAQVADVVRAIVAVAPRLGAAARAADLSLRSRAWSDAKVSAHHAIIPTPTASSPRQPLSADEQAIYDLIARRYLAQFYPPHAYLELDVELDVAEERFIAKGRQLIAPGWRQLYDALPDAGASPREHPEVADPDDVAEPHGVFQHSKRVRSSESRGRAQSKSRLSRPVGSRRPAWSRR